MIDGIWESFISTWILLFIAAGIWKISVFVKRIHDMIKEKLFPYVPPYHSEFSDND